VHPGRAILVLSLAVLSGAGCHGDTTTPGTAPAGTTVAAHAPTVLYRPARWKVGDAVTTDARRLSAWHLRAVGADGKLATIGDQEETLLASWVERTTDVDEAGRRTGYLVYVREWSRTWGSAKDESLLGMRFAVRGEGAGRTWSALDQHQDPTTEARIWLDEHFGAHGIGDEQWSRLLLEDRAVAPGESWHPDPGPLGDAATASGLAVDRAKVTAAVTLEAIEDTARCSFDASLPLLRVPTSQAPWISGGILRVEGSMSVALDASPPTFPALRRRTMLSGDATENDATVRYEFVTDEQRIATPGGTFPETQP